MALRYDVIDFGDGSGCYPLVIEAFTVRLLRRALLGRRGSASMKSLDVETDPKMRSTSRIVASWLLRGRLGSRSPFTMPSVVAAAAAAISRRRCCAFAAISVRRESARASSLSWAACATRVEPGPARLTMIRRAEPRFEGPGRRERELRQPPLARMSQGCCDRRTTIAQLAGL